MKEREPYTPLNERLNQDVMHDNFVPKYSALASAPPTKMVLIGVWLLFVPMTLSGVMCAVAGLGESDRADGLLLVLMGLGMTAICVAILFKQTKRYRVSRAKASDSTED